ncbi:translocation/assembly module TamB domain-containing protein [Cyclobacterium jeungdonense]|uniref:Translocation/assembly module TamB domain-containing protein n=1 Tax=Cyclobacterium jeungdonense TaxID=708087 RepID=A0ABT8C354_9BACT|nr:translocation/assembly module TamB domain-containing protein [Cyclobacterium jeungdonense]MDN3687205.1 translocation/assembly module TamB domain-containing protein [Cyclobacterium jeungdonense]
MKALRRVFLILRYVLFFLIFLAILLQIPTIQTYLAGFITNRISTSTGYLTDIGRVNLRWWDAISLRDVRVYDLQDSLMADLDEVYIDFSVRGLLNNDRPGLDEVNLRNGNVRLLTHQDGEGLNISVFLERLRETFFVQPKKQKSTTTTFGIASISFDQTSLDIIDYTQPEMDIKFDYANLLFRDLVARAENFYVRRDTVAFDLRYMKGVESNSGMVFQQLRTNFIYSGTGMEFKYLYLKSNETVIKNYLRMDYESVADLRDFNRKVDLIAQLDEAVLDIRDLRYFSDNIPPIDDRIYLSGEIIGKINSVFSEELLLRFGERSALFGKFNIEGLPLVKETFFNLSLTNSVLLPEDLYPYVSSDARKELDKFGTVRFDSDFEGYLSDFTAKGDFRTGIGLLKGQLNYRDEGDLPTYEGQLEAVEFNLGVLSEDPEKFQKVSFKGDIKGTGLTLNTALIELDASISKIGINQYDFNQIETKATYGKDLFQGTLSVNDSNLVMSVDGTLDLRNNKDSANLMLRLDTAFLNRIHLTEKDIFLSGNFELDTKGIHWDNIEGVTRFRDVLISYDGRDLFLDYFLFQSLFTEDSRVISLNSDLLVAGISGDFKVQQLGQDIQRLWEDYYAILTNDYSPPTTKQPLNGDPYHIDLTLDFRDPNPILNLIDPRLFISSNTQMEGAFYKTERNTVFNFYSGIDTIYYNDNYFINTDIDLNTSKYRDSDEVLASFYVLSKEIQLSSGFNFHNLSMETIWDQSRLNLSFYLDQLQTESYANISAGINLSRDQTQIEFAPSEIKLLEDFWQFEPGNSITIGAAETHFQNLKIFHENQYLSAEGKINLDPGDQMEITVNELNLDFLNSFGMREYEGTANGRVILAEGWNKEGMQGTLSVEGIRINDFLVGEIEADALFADQAVNLSLQNYREGKKVIELSGNLGSDTQEMALTAAFENANLSVIEPFISDYLSQIDGNLSGNLKVGGSITRPIVEGLGKLEGATFRFNYLNTTYLIDGNVIFEPNDISFRGLELKDVNNNTARLRGGITHDNFANFILDLDASITNFQVMNTSAADNDLFFGEAYATGNINVFGAANNLDLTANATSQPNTQVFIPIGDTNGQSQEDFINIINVRDTTQSVTFEETVDKLTINNLRMNLNLDLTPDAYVEIQIDPKTEENIQGRGRGVLNLNIDTQGNFNMTGNFEIVDALYNFSLYNVINKKFLIVPGGVINWYGDPYEGVMDISAVYEENVSLASLQTTANQNQFESNQLKRRFPVQVIMDLDGPLLSPDISFEFDFSEFPEDSELQTTISAFRNRIANDEQEKNRQVFSLIMLRRFSPEGQFSGAGIGFSNLSQLISSQLNNLVAQVDENLEIDFDLVGLDDTALETFQLRVAYTFFDGRLRVTRDGGFTDLQGNADFNTIAGDWQAEYLLTEDGRYRVRVYNRNNFNTLTALGINNRAPNTYGVSISQNLLFSSLKELFQNFSRSRDLPISDSDEYLRGDFTIDLDEVAPELFRPDPQTDPSGIRILEKEQPEKP